MNFVFRAKEGDEEKEEEICPVLPGHRGRKGSRGLVAAKRPPAGGVCSALV